MYNYLESIKEDVKEYIKSETSIDALEVEENRDEIEEMLHDDLWVCDSVTGNASGSYTFNRHQAKEYVLDNIDLLKEMCNEFCVEAETIGNKFLNDDWEWMDVSIRCYLLGEAISKALDEIEGKQC
jgi:hypothetical protein